jgi:hypothetical protein
MQHARGADQSRAERPGSRRVLGPSHEPDPSLLLMKYGLITRSREKKIRLSSDKVTTNSHVHLYEKL